MTYVKKVTMQGFKSFARKTEIPLENAMNVIVGPNGSGKSNITDALCFVLGRLSIKSIRAAKAANLLFSGNASFKSSQEASVEIIFDNSQKTFAIDSKELIIKRIVRKNGLSIYKINNETKTRQELIETLAQAGIDPNGFNIVLQGEIQSMVKASPEERRKIIEEVAGISIYETRKEKSLKELEKTDARLKEVSAILKEKNSLLKSLEKERQDALSHQKLKDTIKKCKATLIFREIKEKESEVDHSNKNIKLNEEEINKLKKTILENENKIKIIEEKIDEINKKLTNSSGIEQSKINNEIAELNIELASLKVRLENFQNNYDSNNEKLKDYKEKIKELNEEINLGKKSSPRIKEQQELSKELTEKLNVLENKRRKFYQTKSEIETLENKRNERKKSIIETKKEIDLIKENVTNLGTEIKHSKSIEEARNKKESEKSNLLDAQEKILILNKKILSLEKEDAVLKDNISRRNNLSDKITSLEKCPVCKQIVTKDHKHEIKESSTKEIENFKINLQENEKEIEKSSLKIKELKENEEKLSEKIKELEIDIIKLRSLQEKESQVIKLKDLESEYESEITNLNEKINKLKKEYESLKDIEQTYDSVRLELQELSFLDLDIDSDIAIKQKELNRLNNEIRTINRELEESKSESKKISEKINEKEIEVTKKKKEEQIIYEKFQKLFEEKNELQDQQKGHETTIIGFQHSIRNFEEKINHEKIKIAQFSAQLDSLKTQKNIIGESEILNLPTPKIKERLSGAEFKISRFGNVNMKALEMYETVKDHVGKIEEKVQTINQEKEKISKIIYEIDKKKKKAFLKTLFSINEIFSRNFGELSKKGSISLELENKKDPFEGGLNIIIKASRGKYFDITSLSGGEKTMVVLALIFAIQEYSPYSFYIFDEIDAALDKHNSELLAALIKKHMTTGQYIIITHNDTLISEATNLYGVSMQENISKIVSLKV